MWKTAFNTLGNLGEIIEESFYYPFKPPKSFFLLLVIILSILFIRRPYQLIHPDVWVEDGLFFIPEFFRHGFWSIFRPINGYLTFVPRLITGLSLQFPLEWYPAVSTLLGVCLNSAVFFFVAFSPTVLKNKILCALAVFLIPIFPEVYILPSYTLWMCSVLLILVLLWRSQHNTKRDFYLRAAILATCGLSTPFVVFLLPLFLVRFLIIRTRNELALFLFGICFGLIQMVAALKTLPSTLTTLSQPASQIWITFFNSDFLRIFLIKFFGFYLVSPTGDVFAFCLSLLIVCYLVLMTVALFRCGILHSPNLLKTGDGKVLLLLYPLLFVAIFSTLARLNIIMPHPVFAGPRYFFLPYTVLSWILISLPSFTNWAFKRVGFSLLLIAFINSAFHFTDVQEPLDWQSPVKQLRLKGESIFLIHYDGKIKNAWFTILRR